MTRVQTMFRSLPVLALTLFLSNANAGPVHPADGRPEASGVKTRFHPRCHSYYSGSIASYAFTMVLNKYDTVLEGTYAYAGRNTFLTLKGSVGPNGRFRIYEYDIPSNAGIPKLATGTFEGVADGDSLTGTWRGKRAAKPLPFHAARFVPDKQSALTAAIGEHRLTRAGGSMGANGMFGYEREKGKWTGVSSSISGGQREGESTSFKKEELRLLNSLKLLVHPDLALDIVVGRDTLLHVPYNPMGMHYAARPFDGKAGYSADSVYEPARTFYEDKLALAYLDSADFSAVLGPLVEDLFFNVADRMRLDYRPINDEFELTVGHDYFENSVLTFGTREGKRK
jgi:hypothetical protein